MFYLNPKTEVLLTDLHPTLVTDSDLPSHHLLLASIPTQTNIFQLYSRSPPTRNFSAPSEWTRRS